MPLGSVLLLTFSKHVKSALGCGYVGPLCVTHLTNWAEH